MLLHFKKYFLISPIKHNNILIIYYIIYNKYNVMLDGRNYEIFLETQNIL